MIAQANRGAYSPSHSSTPSSRFHRTAFAWAAFLPLGFAILFGCDSKASHKKSVQELKTRWSGLEGAKQSEDPVVRSEIATVLAAGGGPQQLMRPLPDPTENVAAGLVELFTSGRQKSLLRKVDAVMPDNEFQFDPIRVQKVIRLVRDETDLLHGVDDAVSRPKCHFAHDYTWGYSANTDILDLVDLCVRLKALEVAALLNEDQPAQAAFPLSKMFRLISLVSLEPHAHFRMAAVQQRELAFQALDKVSSHPDTNHETLVSLRAQVIAQLNNWPSDAAAWIGDRALALYSYEMIRDGYALELLTPDEVEQFGKEGKLKDLTLGLKRSADSDERYYLLTMQKVLASCKAPYFQRKKLFESLRKEQHAKRGADDFPEAAVRLFLSDIEEGHLRQAEDRRRAETRAIALSAAAGVEAPPFLVDPVTGQPYDLQRQQTRVSVRVSQVDDSEVIVPHPKPVAISARPRR